MHDSRHSYFHATFSLTLLLLWAGCCLPLAPAAPAITDLPRGEWVLVGGTLDGGPDTSAFYLLLPGASGAHAWQLHQGRGLTEGGSSCIGRDEHAVWKGGLQFLELRGHLGCTAGDFRIDASGHVSTFEAPGVRVSALTEGMGFEDLQFARWAPDGSSISFIGGSRPNGVYQRRAYRAEHAPTSVRSLGDHDVLADSAPFVHLDGATLFVAVDSSGVPTIYRAARGKTAEPLLALSALPQPASWSGALFWSPDGRRAVLSHRRENKRLPETIYLVDLDAGTVTDLLPSTIALTRTGDTARAEPPVPRPHGWSPDGQRVLFSADFSGRCAAYGPVKAIGCTSQLYAVAATGGAPERLYDAHFTTVRFAVWSQ